jgi:hypothetical protein
MSQINPTIPVQTVVFVYGTNVEHMGKQQLLNAASTLKADIKRLTEANEGVESAAIAQEIANLESALVKVRDFLDAQYAAPAEVVAEDETAG